MSREEGKWMASGTVNLTWQCMLDKVWMPSRTQP